MNKILLLLLLLIAVILPCSSQSFAVKSNLLYDATATLNLGVEGALNKKWTLGLLGNYNRWTFSDNMKWKHWMVQPEAKYWFCENFNGSSLGFHLLGGEGNVGNLNIPINMLGTNLKPLKDYRYEGWFVGGGVDYGYSWILSNRWNLEAALGIGYIRFDYDKFTCYECGTWLDSDINNYVGITKVALNIVYIIK
ncbi:MAG: hypothetical protein RL662_76 [Bacteroidota bacterium]